MTYVQQWPFLCVSVVEGAGGVEAAGTCHELVLGMHFLAPTSCGDLHFKVAMTLIAPHV